MIVENETGNNMYGAEITDVDKSLLDYLLEVLKENNAIIDKVEWRSKYNRYVIYDYEPWCTDGFYCVVCAHSADKNKLDFSRYLFEARQDAIKHLYACSELNGGDCAQESRLKEMMTKQERRAKC